MVVFEQGAPSKSLYRHFTVRDVQGQDDFASMEEVLQRRFRRWKIANEQAEKPGGKLDKAFGILPDLLIVDGGKGQLGRAAQVLSAYGLEDKVPIIGLAKRFEEVHALDRSKPLVLPRRSEGLYLLQRIRDEAHRFALRQHKSQRRRKGLGSRLDDIEGIGPARRKALLEVFGDVEAIRKAQPEELAAVPGISANLAARVKAQL
jgi:excinuclease ABC subunit C